MAQEVNVRGIARVPFGAGSASTTTVSGSAVATLDLDNGQTRRALQNERARFVVLPDLYPVMQVSGAVATSGTASGLVVRAPRDLVIKGIDVAVGANGGTVQYDVKYMTAAEGPNAAGTSIFGTVTADRPTIGTGEFAASSGSVTNTAWGKGDYLRVEVAAISGTASNASISIRSDQI